MTPPRPPLRTIVRWWGLAAVFVLLFGGFSVMCALGGLSPTLDDGSALACPPVVGVALVAGWALLCVSFLALMWPWRDADDPGDAAQSAAARGARARGTWMMWGMFAGVFVGAVGGLLWLVPPVLDGRLDAGAWLGTGNRALPVWAMLGLLGFIVAAVLWGTVAVLLGAARSGRRR